MPPSFVPSILAAAATLAADEDAQPAAQALEHAANHAPEHGLVHETVFSAVGLLVVACVVGVLTKFVRIPYTIALVLTGLAIALSGVTHPVLTEELVLLLFLPPLLFQAGLHTNVNLLHRAWAPVLILALPGVLLTTGVVALAVKTLLPDGIDTWAVALLLGIVMAPTDPISVTATFKTAGVPEKLRTVVEGESLFNDGTAVALFTILKAAVITGAAAGVAAPDHAADGAPTTINLAEIAVSFVRMAGLGAIIGLGLGVAAFWLLKRLEDHTLETAITIALAWGAFVLAESEPIHASGVIAVVVAALIIGNYGKVLSMSAETRTTLTGFWDSVDFVVNSVLFLLIGFEIADPRVGGARMLLDPTVLKTAGAILVALFIARAIVVYPVCLTLKGYWPRGWKHVIWWAGLKGSLSLALILGLPREDLRAFLAPVAFLVVLVSLLAQGLTMTPLIRRWRADEPWPDPSDEQSADDPVTH